MYGIFIGFNDGHTRVSCSNDGNGRLIDADMYLCFHNPLLPTYLLPASFLLDGTLHRLHCICMYTSVRSLRYLPWVVYRSVGVSL